MVGGVNAMKIFLNWPEGKVEKGEGNVKLVSNNVKGVEKKSKLEIELKIELEIEMWKS
jgi:hypothetical protein